MNKRTSVNDEKGQMLFKFNHYLEPWRRRAEIYGWIFTIIVFLFFGIGFYTMDFSDSRNYVYLAQFAGFLILVFIGYGITNINYDSIMIFENGIHPPRGSNRFKDVFYRKKIFVPFSAIHDLEIDWIGKDRIRYISFKALDRTWFLHSRWWKVGTITPILQDGMRYKSLRKTLAHGGDPKK